MSKSFNQPVSGRNRCIGYGVSRCPNVPVANPNSRYKASHYYIECRKRMNGAA